MLTREEDVDAHALRRQGWTISAIASSRLLVEVDDVAIRVTQPYRPAPPRLRCRRLEDLNAQCQQTLVACVHVGDPELQSEAPARGGGHRPGHHRLHALDGEERQDGAGDHHPGEGIAALNLCVQDRGIEGGEGRNIVSDQGSASEVWLHRGIVGRWSDTRLLGRRISAGRSRDDLEVAQGQRWTASA